MKIQAVKHSDKEIQVVKKPGFKRSYEFIQGERVIASLNFLKSLGWQAIARIGDREWTFSKKGFWKTSVEIDASQSPYQKRIAEVNWRQRAKVEAVDGKTYHLRMTSFWKSIWSWMDERHTPVIDFRSNIWSRKKRGTVHFHQHLKEEQIWLLLLGWFLMVGFEDESTAAAG